MLTLNLALANLQVLVHANGALSHSFPVQDLRLSDAELAAFALNPRPYGIRLFRALFQDGSVAKRVFDRLSEATARAIVLVLDSPELDGVAWEYAYNDNAYTVEDFAFMRVLPEKERLNENRRSNKNMDRVPLLFIPANPLVDMNGEPMRALDIESEWREMTQHINNSNAPFDLIELRPASPVALQRIMASFQNEVIVHFSGHGAATKDGGFLLFENENGTSNPLDARGFVRQVKDQAWITFLSACQSAVAERTEFANLARELVKAGVPFVLGMQLNLPDPFTPHISGQFYNYLSQGHMVPEAARQARRAVRRVNELYVGMIALYASQPDEVGKIEWSGSGVRRISTFATADVSDLPSPASGLMGRQQELISIGSKFLQEQKSNTVTLHGAGGIGKTALMREALLRFAPSFEATLAIELEPLPSFEGMLGRLERFLNLTSPCSNDTRERETVVRERLISKNTLLGLDNFESVSYPLNDRDSDIENSATSLFAFFQSLATNGVTLCVTSRDVTNLPGETIVDIVGLSKENGGRLFQENIVNLKEEVYLDKVQRVSELVGGHPLALRLLAGAFDDLVGTSLDKFIEDLQLFLPQAKDKWTGEDRQSSLHACFNFTMTNLAKTVRGVELQVALTRLSVFVSSFTDFIAIPVLENDFPHDREKFLKLLPKATSTLHSLWQHGLLERITISEDEKYFVYNVCPALKLFSLEGLGDVESIKNNYWESMYDFAGRAESEVRKSPAWVDITLHVLPDLILASGLRHDESSAIMRFQVSHVLQQFGLFSDAFQLMIASKEILTGLRKYKEVATVLRAMADIHYIRGQVDDALMLLNQALKIDQELRDPGGESYTLHAIAQINELRGEFDEAMALYAKIVEAKEGLGKMNEMSTILHRMSTILRVRGDLNGAMKLLQDALAVDDENENPIGRAVTFGLMAIVEELKGNTNSAIILYRQKLAVVEGLNDRRQIAATLTNLAGSYVSGGKLDEAIGLYERSLKINGDIGDEHGRAAVLHEMALIRRLEGRLEEALRLYDESLEINHKLGYVRGEALTLGMMGSTLWVGGMHEAAIRAMIASFLMLKQLNSEPSTQNEILAEMGEWRKELGAEKFDRLWGEITGQDSSLRE